MTFDEQYPDALPGFQPPSQPDDDGVMKVGQPRECWNCGTMTAYADLGFQAHLCCEECRDVKWAEYFDALRR